MTKVESFYFITLHCDLIYWLVQASPRSLQNARAGGSTGPAKYAGRGRLHHQRGYERGALGDRENIQAIGLGKMAERVNASALLG